MLTKIQTACRPDEIWPEYGRRCLNIRNEKLNVNGIQKTQAARCEERISLIRMMKEFDNVIKNGRMKLESHMESAMLCKAQKGSEKNTP